MPTHHRPGVEEDRARRNGIGAVVDRLVEVREGTVRDRVVKPVRQGIHEQPPRRRRAGRSRPHLPVGLGVRVSRVERDAEDLRDGRVPGRLHVVDALGNDVETEELVRVDVVEQAVGGAPLVGEQRVSAGRVDGEVLPLLDVVGRGGGEVLGVGGGAGDGGNRGHGLDADDAFDGEVRLVDELAGEVVYVLVLVLGHVSGVVRFFITHQC